MQKLCAHLGDKRISRVRVSPQTPAGIKIGGTKILIEEPGGSPRIRGMKGTARSEKAQWSRSDIFQFPIAVYRSIEPRWRERGRDHLRGPHAHSETRRNSITSGNDRALCGGGLCDPILTLHLAFSQVRLTGEGRSALKRRGGEMKTEDEHEIYGDRNRDSCGGEVEEGRR